MVRHPKEKRALIYPIEIEEKDYVGFGSFYIFGEIGADPEETYHFNAILGEEVIQVNLLRRQKSKNLFHVAVPGIDNFVFFAGGMRTQPRYTGGFNQLTEKVAIRKLRPINPAQFEQACKERNFYFIGYTPRLVGLI